MKRTKRLAALLLALAMALSLAGCREGDGGVDATPTPSDQPSASPSPSPTGPETFDLAVCLGEEPGTLDPAINSNSQGAVVINHLFEGLMTWEDSGAAGGDGLNRARLTYGQAEGYDRRENEDGTVTYTFHLRDDIKWSDGKSVTAHDFVNGWQRTVSLGTSAPYAYMLLCVVNAHDILSGQKEAKELAVEAVDDRTFAVTVEDVPYFLQMCALPVSFPVRADVVEEKGTQWAYTPEDYVCNGKYVLRDWSYGTQIVLARNERYYAPGKGPDTITFHVAEDAAAVDTAFQGGQVAFATALPGQEVTELLEKGDMSAAAHAGTYFLTFQTQKAPFDDPRVRQAFTLAVDRASLVSEVTKGGQTPAGGLVPQGVSDTGDKDFRGVGGDYYDPSAKGYKANCRKARELLAQAGYPGGQGFPEVTYLCNESQSHKAVAQALCETWKEALGVTVTVETQEWGAFLQSRKDGDFHIARDSWLADWDDPMTFLDRWESEGANNDAHYQSEAYDQLLADARSAADPARRMKLLHQAEDLLVGEDGALCPLYFYTRPYRMDRKLQGVYYSPLGNFFFDTCSRS